MAARFCRVAFLVTSLSARRSLIAESIKLACFETQHSTVPNSAKALAAPETHIPLTFWSKINGKCPNCNLHHSSGCCALVRPLLFLGILFSDSKSGSCWSQKGKFTLSARTSAQTRGDSRPSMVSTNKEISFL